MDDCIFCKIINREIPAEIVYEDELVLAFKDIHPVTPIHILVIPKKHVESVLGLEEEDKNLVRTDSSTGEVIEIGRASCRERV